MSETSTKTVTFGAPWMLLLTIFFILMKLNVFGMDPANNGFIDWSWVWIFAPLWIPLALVAGIFGVILVFGLLAVGIAALCNR